MSIENSTISGKTATSGNVGGLASVGNLTMTNSTIFSNTDTGDTGGFRQQGYTASLYNTIIANNSGADCGLTDDATLTANVHNLVEDGTCSAGGVGFRSGDPLLSRLTDHGGGTLPHAPLFNSSALDAGDAAACPTTDQRGAARDIGAFEAQLSDTTTVSRTIFGAGTYTFGPTLAKIEVTDTGGCLTELKVERVADNHPNATLPLKTGAYWVITPTGCTSGFTTTLTLPFATANASSRLCRWLEGAGPGAGWDCDEETASHTTFVANKWVIRSHVAGFSAWAVGNDVGPTAVMLSSLLAQDATPALGLTFLVGLICAGVFLTCKRCR